MCKLEWVKRVCGVFLLWATAAVALPAQTLTTLHSFDSTQGAYPNTALVQATDGNFFGTTARGGSASACNGGGCGTVFKITSSGTLTTLYNFCLQNGCPDGANPLAALVQATDGNLYGTTYYGGASSACSFGCGTVFKITPTGTLTTLHSFDSTDGAGPEAGLVQAIDGNLYGTTVQGGGSSSCVGGCGTVFKVTPSGTLTMLHSFDVTDGVYPFSKLIQATDGNFYGTTDNGGAGRFCSNSHGCGTIFRIIPSGRLTTIYSFCTQSGCPDGFFAIAALVQAADGNFYGTTELGGAIGSGTVFKITPNGTLTTLHSFDDLTDGGIPFASLVQATDGNFYGTTQQGGANTWGTVFKITSTGRLTTLYSFDLTDGAYPYAGLVQATSGNLYGATTNGGASSACPNGCGTVFGLSVDLGPFVETQPTSGKVGASVKILGSGLIGATSVTFNGTAAAFTVVSHSLIITSVPVGATTGEVQVITPSRTLSSNVPFTVRP